MHKKDNWEKRILVICFSLIFIVTGCQGIGIRIGSEPRPGPSPSYKDEGPPPWAPAHGYRAKYKYRYYPSAKVYYDEGRGIYFYYKDGKWRVSASIPVSIRIEINDFITLEMDTDKPYEHNAEIEKKYPPGQLKKKDKKKDKYR